MTSVTWGTEDGTGRWSPFPVQDWDRLPADPTDPAEPGLFRRPARLPLLVLTLCLVLLAGSILTFERLASVTAGRDPYLPEDGATVRGVREIVAGGRTEVQPAVIEAAVMYGSAMLGSVDFAFGTQLLGALDIREDTLHEVGGIRLWRSTLTTPDRQATAVYRIGDGIDLLAEDRPLDDGEPAVVGADDHRTDSGDRPAGRGHGYRPALTELPAGATIGSTWRDRGTAGDGIEYASDFRAEAATGHPAGCLQTSGRIVYTDTAGTELEVRRVRRVWCRGRGAVESSETTQAGTEATQPGTGTPQPGSGTTRTRTEHVRAADWPPADPVPANDPAPGWTEPARWQPTELSPVSRSPSFGEAPLAGVPASVPPVITAAGRLVRAAQTGQDLIVLIRPGDPGTVRSLLRLHPGGTVTSLAAFGRMIIVTTSRRQVIGYTDTGLRLWQRDLPEVVEGRPARLGDPAAADPLIVLSTIDGAVHALRLRTGTELWRRPAGAQVLQPAAPAGDSVVLGGDDGTLTVLAAADGAERWSVPGLIGQPHVLGSTVITAGDGAIEARDLADGRTRWRLPYAGTLSGTAVAGDRLIVATRVNTMILDSTGTVRHRLGPLAGVVGHGPWWAGWSTDRLMIMDPDGVTAAGWPLPAETWGSGTRVALITPTGIQLHASGWGFTEWAP